MNRTMKIAATALLVGLALGAAPRQAAAQAWIGQMAGEMAARDAAIAREKACRAGQPAAPNEVTNATTKADALMGSYFALTSTSNGGAVGKVFDMKTTTTTWKSPEGAVAVTALGARLDAPTPKLTPVAFVVGGDAMTARGIWSASEADGGPVTAVYAVDFMAEPNLLYGFSWRIWHMTVLAGGAAPTVPGAYCHYDPDQAW